MKPVSTLFSEPDKFGLKLQTISCHGSSRTGWGGHTRIIFQGPFSADVRWSCTFLHGFFITWSLQGHSLVKGECYIPGCRSFAGQGLPETQSTHVFFAARKACVFVISCHKLFAKQQLPATSSKLLSLVISASHFIFLS